MKIDENTRVIARLHKSPSSRGLNIYNPYFEETGENAVYVLFYKDSIDDLVDGLRKLNMAGAIAAGFEKEADLLGMLDDATIVTKRLKKIGIIINNGGKLVGHYQGGNGLLQSILSKGPIGNKKMIILGAGTVVRGMVLQMELDGIKPNELEIYNRTPEKAEQIAEEFDFVSKIGSLKDLEKSSGDIFVNTTDIGASWNKGDDYKFSEKFISNFNLIADVCFSPIKPQLIQVAEKLRKEVLPGYKMFLYQGKICLEKILGIDVKENIIEEYILQEFSKY